MRAAGVTIVLILAVFWVMDTNAQKDAPEKQTVEQPITVNGDTVEYSTENNEVTATDNVSVIYKGTTLTCEKLSVNTATKDGKAEGNVRIEDNKGVIEGTKMTYNFQTKAGIMDDSEFRFNPYFGRAERVKKISDDEFIAQRGYMTTCSFDKPHYRIKTRKTDFFPGDKIKTKDDIFYIGRVPVFYLPRYNHSLRDPMMQVQLMPGKSKEWGAFLLTAWKYKLTEDVTGRIYFDERQNLGNAQGFGVNYKSQEFGHGDFKYYYTQERDKGKAGKKIGEDVSAPKVFQRYFIRWRHQWEIDDRTNLTSEYYKIEDSKKFIFSPAVNLLKDYFPLEYEKDNQPLSYALLHHNFDYSSLDFMVQKRTNRWYTQLEKLPEIKYTLPSHQIGDTPFYFDNNTQIANYNQKNTSTLTPTTNALTPDVHENRFDTSNKLSLPMKIASINISPFVMSRQTLYDADKFGSHVEPRTIFYSGSDASTKFYRIFNIKTNFLGLDLNGLRHIVTPTVGYSYNHTPTVPSSKLKQIDGTDAINVSNSATLELSNKLQTKRNNQSIDLVDFRVRSSYGFKPRIIGDSKNRGSLSDILFDLKLLPYSWLTMDADATYRHSGDPSAHNYNHFTNVNYDMSFNFGKERSFAVGQRYQLKGGNEITYNFNWRIDPKWKLAVYQRYNRGHDPNLYRGLREQTYTLSRDLHCWVWDITYNVRRGYGEAIYFVFRLKAFPEMEFGLSRAYHERKPGSQSNY